MAKRRKKQYSKTAKRKTFMQGFSSELKTKGDMKNTALETGKDILVCVLGGGLIGAAIGRPSLAVGIVTTGLGKDILDKKEQKKGKKLYIKNLILFFLEYPLSFNLMPLLFL